jgi:uncharacterized protein YuzE
MKGEITMKATIIGLGTRRTGEKAQKSGKPYDMQDVFYNAQAAGVTGQKAGQVLANYRGEVTWPALNIGDKVDLDFDEKGNLTGVTLLEKAK